MIPNNNSADTFSVQAFLNKYETVTRSDGSTISIYIPCGNSNPNVDAFGSLITEAADIKITGSTQVLELLFSNITSVKDFTGSEIGGCNRDKYEDTELFKHIKIRSEKLGEFWGRDMYVGANVLPTATMPTRWLRYTPSSTRKDTGQVSKELSATLPRRFPKDGTM